MPCLDSIAKLQVGVDFEGGVAFADSDVVVVAAGAEEDVGFRSFAYLQVCVGVAFAA